MKDWADHFVQALAQQQTFNSVEASHPGLSLSQAYQLQRQCINLLGTPVIGFKAALTAPAAQQAMGIDAPIVGALLADGRFTADITHTLQRQALLETEFGFKLKGDILQPVNADSVMANVASCHAMIEVASPNLSNKPSGLDLIATNSASFGYVLGAAIDLPSINIDQIAVSLKHNGELCFSGHGADVMGGQASALAWLINEVLSIGYPIRAGHLLMTGSIGGMQPARPGHYEAEFSGVERLQISFA